VGAAAEVGRDMRLKWLPLLFCCGLLVCAVPARAGVYYVTAAGLGGEPDYEQEFTSLATDLDRLLKASGSDAHVYTLDGNDATRARLTDVLGKIASQAKPDDDFVLILIGHGSYDGVEYKFNLVGPDISAADLTALCDRIAAKRQLIVNTTSSSGGSIPALEKRGRCVIAATKSGTEKNATVFARYWVEALHDPEADLDKNETISALEAFQYATKKTAAFYDSQKRLATEHAVFDDTGHHDPVREPASDTGEGQLLSSFTLIRLGSTQRAYNDPAKRALLAQKEELERKIDTLKYQKMAMSQDDYKTQLTAALLELAKLQDQLDK
jgi:DNA repair exonuclease SbcCD nuclease subunit